MKCGLIVLFIVAILLLAVGAVAAAPAQVADQPAAVSFGLVMKPGWGGGQDPPYNYTLDLILRCAMLNKYRYRQPGTTTIIMTGTLLAYQRTALCAQFPMRGMGTGDPIGDGYPPSLYSGTTDAFPAR